MEKKTKTFNACKYYTNPTTPFSTLVLSFLGELKTLLQLQNAFTDVSSLKHQKHQYNLMEAFI